MFNNLIYDTNSPTYLRWDYSGKGRRSDLVAGCNKGKYYGVVVNGIQYLNHRIIALKHGIFTEEEFNNPEVQIDHKDGNAYNNLVSNLRKVNNRINGNNRKEHRKGKLVGVKPNKSGTFGAQIRRNGKKVYLGTFNTEQEAHEAYLKELRGE